MPSFLNKKCSPSDECVQHIKVVRIVVRDWSVEKLCLLSQMPYFLQLFRLNEALFGSVLSASRIASFFTLALLALCLVLATPADSLLSRCGFPSRSAPDGLATSSPAFRRLVSPLNSPVMASLATRRDYCD